MFRAVWTFWLLEIACIYTDLHYLTLVMFNEHPPSLKRSPNGAKYSPLYHFKKNTKCMSLLKVCHSCVTHPHWPLFICLLCSPCFGWPGLLSSSSSSPPVSSPSSTPGGPTISANSSPMKDASSPAAAATQPRSVRRAPQGPQALMPLPCKKAEGLQYNNFKCPECQTQFSGKAELVTHFQQIRAAPNSVSLGDEGTAFVVLLFCAVVTNCDNRFFSLIFLLSSPIFRHVRSARLPWCSLTLVLCPPIRGSISTERLMSVLSAVESHDRPASKPTWTRPVCTLPDASATGVDML